MCTGTVFGRDPDNSFLIPDTVSRIHSAKDECRADMGDGQDRNNQEHRSPRGSSPPPSQHRRHRRTMEEDEPHPDQASSLVGHCAADAQYHALYIGS